MIHNFNDPESGIIRSVNSVSLQISTFRALAVRFVMTRYGRENIGFLWLFIEPMLLCGGVMLLWSAMKGSSEHGVSIVSLVFSGYMPLTLWRHLSNSGIFVLRSSRAIVIHRNITFFDIVITRLFLETLACSAAAVFVFFIIYFVGYIELPFSAFDVAMGWLLMAILGSGFAMILASATERFDLVEKFVQPIQYLVVPLSGCFYMVDWLPPAARAIVVYIPLVHCYELIRAGLFGPSAITYGNMFYGYAVGVIILGFGFYCVGAVRDRIGV